jgi:hypothetical protein
MGGHAWFRAKWLGDLARIHADGRVDWQAVLGQASRTGQERALLASLRLLQDVYGLPVPDFPGNPWKESANRFLIVKRGPMIKPLGHQFTLEHASQPSKPGAQQQ